MTRPAIAIGGGTRTDSDVLIDVLDRLDDFDVAWRRGLPPNIEDFLGTTGPTAPGTPDGPGRRRELLAELIKIDLEYRWNRPGAGPESPGETTTDVGALPQRPRLEDYVRRFPELGPPGALPLSLIGEEYRVRRRFGDAPSRAEFARRFEGHPAGPSAVLDAIGTEVDSSREDDTEHGPDGATMPPARTFRAEPRVAPPGERFQVLKPHARGGLGEVFVAHDVELNRRVALKEIQGRHADRLDSRARFIREAEITGALEHPGIVPVYALGRHGDGRPYYAMRFIRGESLKEAIDRYHAPAGTADPAARALAFRELLGRFVAVCNAIAFAHSKHVVHRDLKPANVMLGKYGETLVVDWGLAKVVGAGGAGVEPDVEVDGDSAGPSPEGAFDTRPGQVFGTPAYMSPEQAIGDPARIGPAGDIYSLGATLYHLLVGRPPVIDEDPRAGVDRVLRGEIPPPRAVNPDVPPALEAVCLKAMAPEPEGRYETARALATDVERWLAGAPVSAWREPWTVRAGRWLSRHRTLVTAGAASGLVAIVGLSAVNVVLGLANRTEVRLRHQAEDQYRLAMQAVRAFHTGASEEVLLRQPELTALRRKLLAAPLGFYRQIKENLERNGDARPEARAELAEASIAIGKLTFEVGSVEEAVGPVEEARALLERLVAEQPSNAHLRGLLAEVRGRLGEYAVSAGRLGDAERHLRAGIELAQALEREHPGDRPIRHLIADIRQSLAKYHYTWGRFPECELEGRAALEVYEALAREAPRDVPALEGQSDCKDLLGTMLESDGRFALAERAYREAFAIRRGLVQSFPGVAYYRRDLARSHDELAHVHMLNSRLDRCEREYREALAIRDRLVAEHPTTGEYRLYQAISHNHLGTLAYYEKRTDVAEAEFEAALAALRALEGGDPFEVDRRDELARAQGGLGRVYLATGRFDRAEVALRAALAVIEPMARSGRSNVRLTLTRASTWANLGRAQTRAGKLADAAESLGRGVAAAREVLAAEPDHVNARAIAVEALQERSRVLAATGRATEALADLDGAMSLSGDHYESELRCERAILLVMAGHYERAAAEAESIDDPANPGLIRYNRACVLARASAAAAADGALAPADRRRRADAYAARAVALLREADALGFFRQPAPLANFRADPDLDPLRGRDDFRALLRDLAFPADPFARGRDGGKG
ncbi:MAG TPA: protein kinase [Isosphaeraceae bacterium]|jgi:serine/threonine-protein kinase|nr:protein kinase [Isosphaeraceae bacterium]